MKKYFHLISTCLCLLAIGLISCEPNFDSKSKSNSKSTTIDPNHPKVEVEGAVEKGKALPLYIDAFCMKSSMASVMSNLNQIGYGDHVDILYRNEDFLEYYAPEDVDVVMVKATKYIDEGGITITFTFYDDVLYEIFVGGVFPCETALEGLFLPWSESLNRIMDSKGWEGEIHCWANECYNDGKGVQKTRADYVRFIQKHSSISKYEYGWIDEQWDNGTIKAELYLDMEDRYLVPDGYCRIWYSYGGNPYKVR